MLKLAISRGVLVQYFIVVVAIAVAAVIRLVLEPVLGGQASYIFFLPAILIASAIGGWAPGVIATVLGLALGLFFVAYDRTVVTADILNAVVFVFVGVGASWRGELLCIAPDQRQAGIVLDYVVAAFEASPILRQLIANRTTDTLELTNGVNVEVRSASFRRLRGPTYIAVIADEAAFWYSDEFSANADSEILNAVRPGLATTGGPLIIASSPYAKRGVLFEAYKRHYGAGGDPLILVAQGASRNFNPSLPQSVVDRAIERDAASASAEYLAQFRSDVETFVSREVIDAAVVPGRHELPPISGVSYFGFVDPSGGSADAMTMAIGHRQDNVAVIDAVRERRPPFSPEDVVQEFAGLLRSYRIHKIVGDRYAGEWPRERFQVHGVRYEPAAKPFLVWRDWAFHLTWQTRSSITSRERFLGWRQSINVTNSWPSANRP